MLLKSGIFKEETDVLAFLIDLFHQFNDFLMASINLHIPESIWIARKCPFWSAFSNHLGFQECNPDEQEYDAG